MTDIELDELSRWLSANHHRSNWELVGLLALRWPKVTAREINQAWQSMSLLAMGNFGKNVGSIDGRTASRSNDNEVAGEPD